MCAWNSTTTKRPHGKRVRLSRRYLQDRTIPLPIAVTLTASELVTNVVRHTDSAGVMQAWDPKPDVPLRLEVEDHERALPKVVSDPTIGGRGLSIVDNMADAWGVDPTVDGKVIWAEFNRPSE